MVETLNSRSVTIVIDHWAQALQVANLPATLSVSPDAKPRRWQRQLDESFNPLDEMETEVEMTAVHATSATGWAAPPAMALGGAVTAVGSSAAGTSAACK